MVIRLDGQDVAAKYLFTIDYNGTSLADDPEQRKTHNILQLSNNQIAAMPNNKCLVLNKSLTTTKEWPTMYRRISKYYTSES
jgi:Iap family predicted aminopeptidase